MATSTPEPVLRLLSGLDSIRTMRSDEELRHDEAIGKARKLGQEPPAADLPRATSVRWVRKAARILRDVEADGWYSHEALLRSAQWDPVGVLLARLRTDPEFVTIAHAAIDIRWSTAAWVDRDVGDQRVVLGRVVVIPREERFAWPAAAGDDVPAFRLRLSVPAVALATDDELERALHALLCECGWSDGPVKRKPDIVAHAANLARYGTQGIRAAHAVAAAMRHPETRAALVRYKFDPTSGQGLLWEPRAPRQGALGVA